MRISTRFDRCQRDLLTLSSSAQKNLLSNSTSYPLGNMNDKSQFDFYYKVQTKLLLQSTEYYFLTIDYQLGSSKIAYVSRK